MPKPSPDRAPALRTNYKGDNPKTAMGDTKVDLTLCSPIAMAHWAIAAKVGGIKYGEYNWRGKPVPIRTYIAAAIRHLQAYLEGEQYDEQDHMHHLGGVMACAAILLDAEACGTLIDDRPIPKIAYREVMEELRLVLAKFKAEEEEERP